MLTRPFRRSHWRFNASASRTRSSRSEGVPARIMRASPKLAKRRARRRSLFVWRWSGNGLKVDKGSRQRFRFALGGETASRERAIRSQAGQRDEIDVRPAFQLRLDRGAPTPSPRGPAAPARRHIASLARQASVRRECPAPCRFATATASQGARFTSRADNAKACPSRTRFRDDCDPVSAPAMRLPWYCLWRCLKSRPVFGQGVDRLPGRSRCLKANSGKGPCS